jgi:hypothetical protein
MIALMIGISLVRIAHDAVTVRASSLACSLADNWPKLVRDPGNNAHC